MGHLLFSRLSNLSKQSAIKNTTMKTSQSIPMNGQENWTNGNQLRWVVGTSEEGPAKVYDKNGSEAYAGTYKGAVAWLEARGNRPVYRS